MFFNCHSLPKPSAILLLSYSYYYYIGCAFSRKNKYYMDVRTRTDIANKVFIVMHFLKIRFPVFNT